MKVLVSMIVALGLTVVFTASVFAADTQQAEADCEKAAKKWDSKTKTCYSANGY
jgi:hypothetical protein